MSVKTVLEWLVMFLVLVFLAALVWLALDTLPGAHPERQRPPPACKRCF